MNYVQNVKSKITKILNSDENQFGKSIIKRQNQITKRIKTNPDTPLCVLRQEKP